MKLMKFAAGAVLPAVLLFGGVASAEINTSEPAENGYHKHKAVYHINDSASAGAALRNIKNHLNAVGPGNADIVVVTHSKGVDFLMDGFKDGKGKNYDGAVADLANKGVKFDVCNNTLVGRKLDPDKVNLAAKIVPSGVATLAELQQQGYVYIKP